MNRFNKGKSEDNLKEKKKKYNGKEALQCQPVAWEDFQQKKETEQRKREKKKYEWDRPLVDESWTIDTDVPPVKKSTPALKTPPESADDIAGELERNIINSTIMEDEFLLVEAERAKKQESHTKPEVHSKPETYSRPESIYEKYAREDKQKESAKPEQPEVDVRAIRAAVDKKIVIQSEELKKKRTSAELEKNGKKVRRRIQKSDTAKTDKTDKVKAVKEKKSRTAVTGDKKTDQEERKLSKFREQSLNWRDESISRGVGNNNVNQMLDGEGMGFSDAIHGFFNKFSNFSGLQWATVIMAVIIFFTGITTTAVYANYQGEQNKAQAIASLSQFKMEPAGAVEAMAMDEEQMEYAAEEPEKTTGKVLSLVLTSVEKDLKIKLVDEDDTLVRGVPWGVTVTDQSGKTSENEDDDEDGIIHLTDVSAGEYSVQLNPSDALSDYVLPSQTQSVSVKAKVEYKVIQNIKDEIKTEKEVNAAVEDANGNQAADVETGKALTDTVEWAESTKTANGETYEESAVVLTNTAKAPEQSNILVAALQTIRNAAGSGIISERTLAFPALLTQTTTEETDPSTPSDPTPSDPTPSDPTPDPDPVPEPTISVTPSSLSVEKGKTGSVSYSTNNAEGMTVTWSSDNTAVATVSEGTVTGVSAGSATITAQIEGKCSATCSVTVTEPQEAAEVTISASTASVTVGKSTTLTASAKPSGNTVSWSSDSPSIATVSNGTITGVKEGTAIITVTGSAGGSATCTVTVTAAAVTTTLSLDKTAASVATGSTTAITATVTPAAAVTWTSSDASIATVTGSGTNNVTGTVKGVKNGTATITAASGGVSKTCTVTVSASDTALTLTGTASTAVGATTKITATVTPTETTVDWSISDTKIATIAKDGLNCKVTGVKAGSAVLTAKGSNGITSTLTITVTEKYAATAQLYDKDKNALYVYENSAYRLAKYSDYLSGKFTKYFKKIEGFLYTGWQTIDGKTYYYKKDHTYVTGEQIIAGVKYNFATDGSLSQGSGTLGIDVSKYQPSINWSSVKSSGISYAIVRCGYRGSSTGALIQDPYFVSHIKGAKSAGLKVGVYFFTTALSEAEAVEEASMCAALCSGYGINYPVFMDVESSNRAGFNSMSASQRTAIIRAFCNTVKSAGYTPGVYANKTWLSSYMNASELSGYKIWLAQYNAGGPTYSGRYDLWQYTSKGSVNGISGNVDMNQSYLGY